MSWSDGRSRFPVLERYAYLNAGTNGPLSAPTIEAVSRLQAWEAEHGRGGKAYFDEMLERRERVRGLLAAQAGVPQDSLALTESTTRGVQVVALGTRLGPGRRGRHDRLGALRAARPARRVGCASYGSSRSATRSRRSLRGDQRARHAANAPARRCRRSSGSTERSCRGRRCASKPACPCSSTARSPWARSRSMPSAADFYTVSAQKWLCGPDATGALYVREPDRLDPRLVSYPSAASYDLQTGDWEPKSGAARFDTGFTPPSSLAGLEAALTDLPDRAIRTRARARRALSRAPRRPRARGGDRARARRRSSRSGRARTRSRCVDGSTSAGVVLRDMPGTDLLRASVGWWNDERDLERLVAGL